ncbi:acetylcholinesterase-like [Galendromus occidentalis]|uniref:Acetylcholinesterase-like n=1 Tax=Galendromus occidentalis TaxID=34638 RepID=A0AAJ7L494_9ACAR|nr:acetylcholinesterase-like [Galendromus occidentalis]
MFVYLLLPALVLADPVLHTSTGKLHGFLKTSENGVDGEVYHSVPFARPPVGDLRFERPVPYEDPEAVVDATKEHPDCPQHLVALSEKTFINFTRNSEDCLYLNIFKPVTNETDLPIVYYIYGGSFLHGSANFFLTDGDILATETNVIYVIVNYRLGVFGFLTSGGSMAPGNQGLWDILEGLRWTKKNARAIGGNPENITIWGHSAGAIAAGIFMTSPITENLFHHAILQSGATKTGHVLFQQNSPEVTARTLVRLGCLQDADQYERSRDKAIRCAKKLDVETILSELAPKGFDLDIISFQPVIGDDLIPVDPFVKRQKLHSAKSLLVTSCATEGVVFLEILRVRGADLVEGVGDLRFMMALGTKQLLQIPVSAASKIAYSYFDDQSEPDLKSAETILQRYISDMLFICPIEFFTDAAEANGIPVYRASFEARPSWSPWPSYSVAAHGDDLPILSGQALGYAKNVKKSYVVPDVGDLNMTAAEVSWTFDTMRIIGEYLHNG